MLSPSGEFQAPKHPRQVEESAEVAAKLTRPKRDNHSFKSDEILAAGGVKEGEGGVGGGGGGVRGGENSGDVPTMTILSRLLSTIFT